MAQAAEAKGLPSRITLEELMKEQEEDPSLMHAWYWVQGTEGEAKSPQWVVGGLLYRQDPDHKDVPGLLQLPIPSAFRWTILQLAHNIPLVGHLGAE